MSKIFWTFSFYIKIPVPMGTGMFYDFAISNFNLPLDTPILITCPSFT